MPDTKGSRDAIARVARALGDRLDEVLFVGAAAATLDRFGPRTTALRPTLDVDIATATPTRVEYHQLIAELRARGVLRDPSPNEESTICRYAIDGINVDLVPIHGEVLGFTNDWYAAAFQFPLEHRLADDLVIKLIAPIYFVASKLRAFRSPDRPGHDDFLASHDIEDMIQVLFGVEELSDDLRSGREPVHDFVRSELILAIAHTDFRYAAESYFSGFAPRGVDPAWLLRELADLLGNK